MKRMRSKKSTNKMIYKKLPIIVLFLAALFLTYKTCHTIVVHAESGEDNIVSQSKDHETSADRIYGNNMSMTVDYGYQQWAKYGRYMMVNATITNKGESFNGWLQVTVPNAENNVVYRKKVQIDTNVKQKVEITIPLADDTGILKVELCSQNDKTLLSMRRHIKIGNYEQQTYVGILSQEPDKLKYFETISTKVFYLDEKNLADHYEGLDLLDVLVISQFDSNRLSEKQLTAIKEWVDQGGTLVVGAGENADDTIAKLKDTYSINMTAASVKTETILNTNNTLIKELKQDILNYAEKRKYMIQSINDRNKALKSKGRKTIIIENKLSNEQIMNDMSQLKLVTVKKNLYNINLAGGSTISEIHNVPLLIKRSLNKGTIMLFTYDMGLESEDKSLGLSMVNTIMNNLSETKKQQLDEEYYGDVTNSKIYQGMSFSDTKDIPNAGKYILVLIIYILLVGPVTYFILKKTDKRSFIWIVIPVLAIAFTFLVYVLGSDTRIKNPFAGYAEIITYQDHKTVEDEIYFGLTAPYNNKYKVEFGSQYNITSLFNSNYNYYMTNSQSKDNLVSYVTSINYDEDKTTLDINDNPAFSTVYYQMKNTYSVENKLTYDIQYLGDKIKGTVTNGFQYDISNAILVTDGYLINVGNILHGKTVDISTKESVFLTTSDIYYYGDFINRVAGGTKEEENNSAETNRKANIFYYLGEKKLLHNNSSYLVGFVKSNNSSLSKDMEQPELFENMIDDLSKNVDSYGTKVVVFPLQVNHTCDKEELVSSIDKYMDISNDSYYSFYYYRFLNSEEQTITYHLPSNDKVIAFEYIANRNQKYDQDYQRNFDGKIYFLNKNTGNYDEVFQAGVGSRQNDIQNYLTEQNTLTVKYSTNLSLQGYQMNLPFISYWKEADVNAGD